MMKNVTLKVEGMSCGHCVKAIESNVGTLNGVENVKVSLDSNTVEVNFDSAVIELSKIKEVIDDQGYDVVE